MVLIISNSLKKKITLVPGDSVVITTGGKSWWIYRLSLGGNSNYDLRGKDTSSENFYFRGNGI
jgi:hypothetical protein